MIWFIPIAIIILWELATEKKATANNTVASDKIITVNGRRVLVHIPSGASTKRKLIYFHGNGDTIENVQAKIIPTFDNAKEKRIVIVPQLDGNGFISEKDLLSIFELLKLENVEILSHSGGYKAASKTLSLIPVKNIGLLDSLYGELDSFANWIKNNTGTFVDVYGPSTEKYSLELQKQVAGKGNFLRSTVSHTEVPSFYSTNILNQFV